MRFTGAPQVSPESLSWERYAMLGRAVAIHAEDVRLLQRQEPGCDRACFGAQTVAAPRSNYDLRVFHEALQRLPVSRTHRTYTIRWQVTRVEQIDLHFHDLKREAGSRWLEAGAPLHKIQKWLGHTTIAQTSTYLMADSSDDDIVMRRMEAQQALVQRSATEPGTGHQNEAQGTTMRDTKAQESSMILQ